MCLGKDFIGIKYPRSLRKGKQRLGLNGVEERVVAGDKVSGNRQK